MTVRWRLTLWYVTVLSLSLAFFGIVVDRLLKQNLNTQMDNRLTEILRAATSALNVDSGGQGGLTLAHVQEELPEVGVPPQMALRLVFSDGSDYCVNLSPFPGALLAALEGNGQGYDGPVTIHAGRSEWRVLRGGGHGYKLLLSYDLASVNAPLGTYRATLLVAFPLILLLAAAGGYFLAGRALKPVSEIAAQARQIEAGALDRRLSISNPKDEFGSLARVLNDLFERLERAFQLQRQFLSDAAHELRTPAAILRSQADVALEKPRTAGEYGATLAAMRAETEHLSAIVDDLLLIARSEASQLALAQERVDLMEITDECCRAVKPLAQAKNLALHWDVADEIPVTGDGRLLRRAIMNLLTNAVRYTPVSGSVSVAVSSSAGLSSVQVSDTGTGIAAEDLPRIFDRFFRTSGSAGPEPDGAGLGLSIVKMVAELHGGRIEVASRPGKGSTFTFSLPQAQRDSRVYSGSPANGEDQRISGGFSGEH